MLFLTRHIETSWNKIGLCQGWESGEISINDFNAYNIVIEEIYRKKIDFILSSDLRRSILTANYIKEKVKFNGEVEVFPEFREMNFGIFEGKPYNEIEKLQAYIFDNNNFFKHNVKLLGGESILDLRRRVKLGIEKILLYNGNILLVTHGNVIRMIYSILYNIEYNDIYKNIDINHLKIHEINNKI